MLSIADSMTELALLCVEIQKRQFLSSACLMKDLESRDAEHRAIESEDMLEPSLQVNSSEENKLVNTVEV